MHYTSRYDVIWYVEKLQGSYSIKIKNKVHKRSLPINSKNFKNVLGLPLVLVLVGYSKYIFKTSYS